MNTIRESNGLEPDRARHSVGPDLGSNCFQWLSVLLARKSKDKPIRDSTLSYPPFSYRGFN